MTRALVLGGGACLWRDLQALSGIIGGGRWPWMVIATNDAGWAYRFPIDHWVTLHGEKLPTWKAMRAQMGYSMEFTTWGGTWVTGRDDRKLPDIDHVLPTFKGEPPVTRLGSSGMHAVDAALHLQADRVVIAGMPMDGSGHFFDPTPWDSAGAHRDAWAGSVPEFGDRVRCVSGWTSDLLGAPDSEWLGL